MSVSDKHYDTAGERIVEVSALLAAGLARLEARKSSRTFPTFEESSLHFSPDQSGHAHPSPREMPA